MKGFEVESILDYLGVLSIVLPIEAEGDLTTAGDVKLTASCHDAGCEGERRTLVQGGRRLLAVERVKKPPSQRLQEDPALGTAAW